MTFDNKRLLKNSVLTLLCFNLAAFFFYYAFDYLASGEIPQYIAGFTNLFISSAIPTVLSVCMLLFFRVGGYKKALANLIPLVLLRLIYLVPCNYIYYMELGNDTADSLLLTALRSLISLALVYVEATLLFLLILFILKKCGKADSDSIDKSLIATLPFDFSDKLTLALFVAALPRFVLNLAKEIINIAEYLYDYSGTYRVGEIIYMLFSLVFILATLLLTQIAATKIKTHLAKDATIENTEDTENVTE